MEKRMYMLTNKLNRLDLVEYSKTVNFQNELAEFLKIYIDFFKRESLDLNQCFDIRGSCLGVMTSKQIEDNLNLTLFRYLNCLNELNMILNGVIYRNGLKKSDKKDLINFFKWILSSLSNLNLTINKDFLKKELKNYSYLIDLVF